MGDTMRVLRATVLENPEACSIAQPPIEAVALSKRRVPLGGRFFLWRPGMGKEAKRTSTGKRLRFEVFKRDHFTCQYCGRQPPTVVLVADHITPVVEGGASTIDNLITACESCNQGKAGKPLGDAAVRPDADLLYLETQQEVAELRRYQEARQALAGERNSFVDAMQCDWMGLAETNWYIPERAVLEVLERYGPDITAQAVTNVAKKVAGGYLEASGYADNRLWAYFGRTAMGMHNDLQQKAGGS